MMARDMPNAGRPVGSGDAARSAMDKNNERILLVRFNFGRASSHPWILKFSLVHSRFSALPQVGVSEALLCVT